MRTTRVTGHFGGFARNRRSQGLLGRYQGQLEDVAQRSAASMAQVQAIKLARLDAMMHKIVDATFDAILTVDHLGRIETANQAAARMFRLPQADMHGMDVSGLLPGYGALVADQGGQNVVGQGHHETEAQRGDGSAFPADIAISRTLFGDDVLHVVVIRDITKLREQQERLEHQALHDALTGLPNRVLLANRVDHALAAVPRTGRPVGLLLLDLDRFKEVNDTLGHHVGDLLLKQLAQRLQGQIRATDTIARLGGDEFAVLLAGVDDLAQARDLAERLRDVFKAPFDVQDGLKLDVGGSIGLAMCPQHANEFAKLMQCADVAMYAAKQGPDKVVVYEPAKDTNSIRQLTLSGELRQAIVGGLLTMEFQPQFDIRARAVTSVEALARWRHPRLGYVPPFEFVTHAEQAGLIPELTRWTFDSALTHLARWNASGLDLKMSVNLSPKMLHDDHMPQLLAELLDSYAVPPEQLTLEITESALVIDPDAARANVQRLAALGVRLAIDDFGTGYSSLSFLQQLPLHELKIDKSFVFGMLQSANDAVIVRSTIDLAHNLGLKVVAEGVESLDAIEALAKLRCDQVQGFFISPAMGSEMLLQWLGSASWGAARRAPTNNAVAA
jgi:diguanylate cyclase